MKNLQQNAALWLAVGLATVITACGGSSGTTTTTPTSSHGLHAHRKYLESDQWNCNDGRAGRQQWRRQWQRQLYALLQLRHRRYCHRSRNIWQPHVHVMDWMHFSENRYLQRNHERECHRHGNLHDSHHRRYAELRRHRLTGTVQCRAPYRSHRWRHMVHRCARGQFAKSRHDQHRRPLQHALSRASNRDRNRDQHAGHNRHRQRHRHTHSARRLHRSIAHRRCRNRTHAINPYIYGWNAFQLSSSAAATANISINRWGGDATSRYNYKLDVTNSASDWYFENQ